MHCPCENMNWKMESWLRPLSREETLSLHCHSVYKMMLPWLPTPCWPSTLEPAYSLAEFQECQLIVDSLLCPSFVPFWICRSVEFLRPLGHRGETDALAYLSGISGLASGMLVLSQRGLLQKAGLSLPLQLSCRHQSFKQENNYSCPWPRGQSKAVGENISPCLLSSGW